MLANIGFPLIYTSIDKEIYRSFKITKTFKIHFLYRRWQLHN